MLFKTLEIKTKSHAIMKQRGGSYMSYESVVEQVKSIPEKYLPVVSDFLSYIQYKVGVIKNNDSDIPKYKKRFYQPCRKNSSRRGRSKKIP